MLNRATPGAGLLISVTTVALLAGCVGAGGSSSPPASLAPGDSVALGASLPAGDTTLPTGCFLTAAEVEAATGKTLTGPPESSTGPKGD